LKIPVYQCGGVIIPQRLRKRRASMLALHDPITLIVALDRNVRQKKKTWSRVDYNTNECLPNIGTSSVLSRFFLLRGRKTFSGGQIRSLKR